MRVFLPALLLAANAAAEIPLAERRSGYDFMSAQTRAMQDDEVTGPARIALLEGESLWDRGCRGCHGEAPSSMKGVAARYPAVRKGKLLTLEQQIRDHAPNPPAFESPQLLALSAFVGRQSRGMPIEVSRDNEFFERGRAAFHRRQGQLNLSCAQCHDERWGRKLAGSVIPQAHPTGYPIYRLEWQGMGSFARRLRNCMIGVRAEPYAPGAPEAAELELYLVWRARGMNVETPAVRP
ncbi:MAG: sulfur oxidation c-type cytochrome SoxA [Betaproteobacteria bacterium]